jgi:ribosomal protein S12 methylthiotransferase accessory factor YcaO
MEPVMQAYHDKNSILDFLPGFDLLNREEILVPAQLVFSRYSANLPAMSAFSYSHTNGLAAGNVLEEAICQALCEVIERDAVSIADLCCSSIPYTVLERIISLLGEKHYVKNVITEIVNHQFVDDSGLFSDVDISEVEFEPIRILMKRFYECGIPLLVKDITQEDIGIPTFIASSAEWITDEYGYFAKGYGCHPDALIALTRAITEVSQTRASNIQGARDDLRKIRYIRDDNILERRWQFRNSLGHSQGQTNRVKSISEIKTYPRKDLLDDIKLILKSLKRAGLKRAIIVDLTDPEIGVPVVRAIVPGLETFEIARLFMDKEIQIGNRAKRKFKQMLYS